MEGERSRRRRVAEKQWHGVATASYVCEWVAGSWQRVDLCGAVPEWVAASSSRVSE